MFITFTREFDHFADNIQNGFLLNEHKVQFIPSTHDVLKSLIPFWDSYNIRGGTVSAIRELRDQHGGVNDSFWNAFVKKCETEDMFKFDVALVLGQFNSAPMKMKCFTEIRDNQKINPEHTGYFGNFGILMREEWLLQNGGCPVIYVNSSMNLTNIIGRTFGILKTLDNCTVTLAGIKKMLPIHHSAFFDFMSFVESSANRFEYEWRIVSGHNLGGQSYLPKIDRAKFKISDVHSFYVPDQESMERLIGVLQVIEPDKSKIPSIFLTNDILLTSDEIKHINKIKERPQ